MHTFGVKIIIIIICTCTAIFRMWQTGRKNVFPRSDVCNNNICVQSVYYLYIHGDHAQDAVLRYTAQREILAEHLCRHPVATRRVEVKLHKSLINRKHERKTRLESPSSSPPPLPPCKLQTTRNNVRDESIIMHAGLVLRKKKQSVSPSRRTLGRGIHIHLYLCIYILLWARKYGYRLTVLYKIVISILMIVFLWKNNKKLVRAMY